LAQGGVKADVIHMAQVEKKFFGWGEEKGVATQKHHAWFREVHQIVDSTIDLVGSSHLLPPIGNKCRQFCTSLVQSLY
jgi:hypothetical protein